MTPGRNDLCTCGSGKKYKQCCGPDGASHAASVNLPQLLQSAIAAHQSGQLSEAEALYRQVLQVDARNFNALHLLGLIATDSGQPDAAVDLIGRAIAVKPNVAAAHHNLGIALKARGALQEAAGSFQRAVALQPDFVEAQLHLGGVLVELGRAQDAVACYRRALAIHADHAEIHNSLGIALNALGRPEEAVASFQRAVAIAPDFAGAYNNLGIVCRAQGRVDEAIAYLQRACAVQPDYAEAFNNLGNALDAEGRSQDAIACYRRALEIAPGYARAHSNLLFTLNYDEGCSGAALFAEHRNWARQHAAGLAAAHHGNVPDATRRIRIGYVSADFKYHTVGCFFEPVLAAHDRAQVEIYCYANVNKPDRVTARLQAQADVWRDIAALDDAAVAQLIREDAIDILVDLSGHTAGNRLLAFARKPAPIQVSWLGYFNTTGLDAMDYAIWDAASLPAEAERWFTEKIVRLPDSRFCYLPPSYAPPVASLPALRRGGAITFGCFNNIAKVSPAVVSLWAKLLHAVPHSRLLLKWKSLADNSVRERYLALFAAHGIGADRLELLGASPHEQMLAEYGDVDIALDPFPYSGGLTSCEALWMGVPLVTLAGARPVSRQTLGYLSLVNLAELAATTPEQYVQIATDLARDLDRLAAVRAGLRATMAASPLCDGPRFARNLEQLYRTMWTQWCANPDSTNSPVQDESRTQ
jgi:predicted O-linked N-acetylglucosamine transferase (SPINDLY family)